MNTQALPQSNDILAKLLAHENIDIVRSNVRTASFDIRNRVLVLPRWKDMSQTCEQMLILHEVGHALFTSEEKYGAVFKKENLHLKEYANVIEDARIESRMKERYPGCRKTFTDGYKELRDKDFFEIKNRDLSKMLLIDRINIYFKVGYNSGVTFNAEEMVYVQRVEKCKTETEVLALASEIYEYSKNKKKEEQEQNIEDDIEYDFDGDNFDDEESHEAERADNDFTNDTAPKRTTHGDVEDGVDPELQPETANALASKLEETADTSLHFEYFEPEFQYGAEYNNVIVNYQTVLSELKGKVEANERTSREEIQQFKSSSASIVNYLIKEFEMKKSATSYKRAKLSKLGQLNLNKLYAYKLKDDIFRQVMVMKEGKKHGMIFLLDWSGSMSNNIAETMQQVINLSMFCQKAQIPFQVFAFTDGYTDNDYYDRPQMVETNSNGFMTGGNFKLLELFSNKMTNAEFNSMISLMLNRPWRFHKYGLNGTPLEDAMLYMTKYIASFKKQFGVEKMSLVTLTDGEGGSLRNATRTSQDGLAYIDGERKKVRAILRDPITRKEYSLGDCANSQMAALRSLISDRYDCKCVGFYIMSTSSGEVTRFYRNNMTHLHNKPGFTAMIGESQSQLRSNKYKVVENMPGYDEFYLLASTKIQEADLSSVTGDMSAAAISRNLAKMFNTRKVSRVVLDKFVAQVS